MLLDEAVHIVVSRAAVRICIVSYIINFVLKPGTVIRSKVERSEANTQTDFFQELRVNHPRSIRNDFVDPSTVPYGFTPSA